MRNTFLEGPILAAMLRLALPILVVLALNTLVGVAETWFVSFLGTNALAGVALVFPLFMLMLMMSNGGIGGGVASAVARAVGAGRQSDADALVTHAVVLAVIFGALFTGGVWIWGPGLFTRMGGTGKSLDAAIQYANLVFLSAIPGWIATLLAAALRGAGNVRVPAIIAAIVSAATIILSPLLIFGWGPIPHFDVAGAGISLTCLNLTAALVFIVYMRRPQSPLQLKWTRLEPRLFGEILKVGLPSAAGTLLSNLTVLVATGLVGTFGRDAIAGYGIVVRLDYLLIPLLFAIGTATVTLVGINIGAGQQQRARRIAWVAALSSSVLAGAIGVVAAMFPQMWLGVFTGDVTVIKSGTAYLTHVAPLYAFFGAGMALYFASQGNGRMAWPLAAGVTRLLVVLMIGGYLIRTSHAGINLLYFCIAVSYLVFGAINLFAMAFRFGWGRRSAVSLSAEAAE